MKKKPWPRHTYNENHAKKWPLIYLFSGDLGLRTLVIDKEIAKKRYTSIEAHVKLVRAGRCCSPGSKGGGRLLFRKTKWPKKGTPLSKHESNSFGLVGVTCPVSRAVAICFFLSFYKSFVPLFQLPAPPRFKPTPFRGCTLVSGLVGVTARFLARNCLFAFQGLSCNVAQGNVCVPHFQLSTCAGFESTTSRRGTLNHFYTRIRVSFLSGALTRPLPDLPAPKNIQDNRVNSVTDMC